MADITPQPLPETIALRTPADKGRFSLAHLLLVVTACAVLAALLASADDEAQGGGADAREAIPLAIGLGFFVGFPLGVLAGRRARNPRSSQALGALFGWVTIATATLLCLRGASAGVALAGLGLLVAQALFMRRLHVGPDAAA